MKPLGVAKIIGPAFALIALIVVQQPTPREVAAELLVQVQGPSGLSAQVTDLVVSCRARSSRFQAALREFWQSGTPLQLTWEDPTILVGRFGGAGVTHVVDLADVLSYPAAPDPPRIPSWASTRCSVLVHELTEARYAKVHGQAGGAMATLSSSALFDASHRDAIVVENWVRRERGTDQCRAKDWGTNEAAGVPHLAHEDAVFRFGGHTERLHRVGTRSITISYELGVDAVCEVTNYAR